MSSLTGILGSVLRLHQNPGPPLAFGDVAWVFLKARSAPDHLQGRGAQARGQPWLTGRLLDGVDMQPRNLPKAPQGCPQAVQASLSTGAPIPNQVSLRPPRKGPERPPQRPVEGLPPEGASRASRLPSKTCDAYTFPDVEESLSSRKQRKWKNPKAKQTHPPDEQPAGANRPLLQHRAPAVPTAARPRLRDVPLPRRPVHVPHDTLHHPLDALAHPFAREGRAGLGQAIPPADLAGAVAEGRLDVRD